MAEIVVLSMSEQMAGRRTSVLLMEADTRREFEVLIPKRKADVTRSDIVSGYLALDGDPGPTARGDDFTGARIDTSV